MRVRNFPIGVLLSLVVLLILHASSVLAQSTRIERSEFVGTVASFVEDAGMPITLTDIEVEEEAVTSENQFDKAVEVAKGLVFLDRVGSKDRWTMSEQSPNEPEANFEGFAEELLAAGFVMPGYRLFRVSWASRGAEEETVATSVGTLDQDDRIVFEPVLYLHGIVSIDPKNAGSASVNSGRWKLDVKNGFGISCVTQEWQVSARTNACEIVDPAPHIEVTNAQARCFTWKQAVSKGEAPWRKRHSACSASSRNVEPTESCIKWIVVSYWASGFSDISVDISANATVSGIGLNAKVELYAGRWGSETENETLGNLCAMSGPLESD